MIIPQFVGRFGNQLFQAATAISYALDNDQPYHIPIHSQNPSIWPTYLKAHQNPAFDPRLPHAVINEHGHHYTPLPKFHADWKDKNVYLSGYFQSAKYFDHHRDKIMEIFNIPYQPLEDYVSIHVRRGDYLQFADKHPPITLDYIREAVLYFIERGYKSFVVCSDDIHWCRQNMDPLKVSGAEFSYSQNRREVEDLALLSCCAHQIISNSSFSWWGQYLNRNQDKICIAPKIWFGKGNEHLSTVDIYPLNCVQL